MKAPNGYIYYFHDLGREQIYLDHNYSCAEGVMVWGEASYYGTCDLQNVNANAYITALYKAFLHFSNVLDSISWTYQHAAVLAGLKYYEKYLGSVSTQSL